MITEEQKARIRYHLGYMNVTAAGTFALGVPAAIKTSFMLESAWDQLLPPAENLVVQMLCRADEVLQHVFGTLDLNDITKTGAIEVDDKRLKKLSVVYDVAIGALANTLGTIPNPYEQRAWVLLARGGINVPMSG